MAAPEVPPALAARGLRRVEICGQPPDPARVARVVARLYGSALLAALAVPQQPDHHADRESPHAD